MPRKCLKFVAEYLIPSLNSERFGKHLKWLDKKKSTFQLDWSHKGGPNWTEREAEVFVEWDKVKGHYQPEDKQYFTKSKQRFRSLLYKLTSEGQIKKLKSDNKYIKVYAIGEKKQRKRKGSLKENSSADNNFCSADEMSSEDTYMCSYEINRDVYTGETDSRILSDDNFVSNELEDHNYSSLNKSLNIHSECEDQVVENVEDPTSPYEFPENLEKKVLAERNYPCSAYDMLPDMDWTTDFKNVTSTKTEGKVPGDSYVYLLNVGYPASDLDENKIPTESTESNQEIHLPNTELFDSSCLFNFSDFLDSDGEFTSNVLKLLQP